MNMVSTPFEFPTTETVAYVRPLMNIRADERAAVSSDPPLRLAIDFLRSLVGVDVASEVAEQAIVVLSGLRTQLRSVGIPTIAASPEGLVGMTWESAHAHVNVQVMPDHRLEYFAENLDTGELWSTESMWGSVPIDLVRSFSASCEVVDE